MVLFQCDSKEYKSLGMFAICSVVPNDKKLELTFKNTNTFTSLILVYAKFLPCIISGYRIILMKSWYQTGRFSAKI